jgi:hypothetical protein
MEFKAGDKVVCIDADGSLRRLEKGKIYTVERIKLRKELPTAIYFKDAGGPWYGVRFVKVEEYEMTEQFKVGDKVKCINAENTFGSLEEGKIYTVGKVVYCKESPFELHLEETPYTWRAARFVKVEEESKMSESFVPGDKVRCKDNSGLGCLLNSETIYTVSWIDTSRRLLGVKEVNGYSWDYSRFVKVEEQKSIEPAFNVFKIQYLGLTLTFDPTIPFSRKIAEKALDAIYENAQEFHN